MERVLEQSAEHPVGVEVLLGERRGRRGSAGRSRRRSPRAPSTASSSVRKASEPLADGDRVAEAGVLDEHGLARRQVADGAVAEPAAPVST